MIFIYLLSFFALLPIFAYLLNQGTANKGYIIGISTIIVFLCIFSFIGKFSYLGFFEEQVLTNEMKDDIKNDTSISTATLNKFEQLIEDENKIYFLIFYHNLYEVIQLNQSDPAHDLVKHHQVQIF